LSSVNLASYHLRSSDAVESGAVDINRMACVRGQHPRRGSRVHEGKVPIEHGDNTGQRRRRGGRETKNVFFKGATGKHNPSRIRLERDSDAPGWCPRTAHVLSVGRHRSRAVAQPPCPLARRCVRRGRFVNNTARTLEFRTQPPQHNTTRVPHRIQSEPFQKRDPRQCRHMTRGRWGGGSWAGHDDLWEE